jgi:hypothetical protein
MKINYNETDKSLEIKDGLKYYYLIIKIVIVLNLINAIIRITKLNKSQFGIEEYLWSATGVISVVALCFHFFKESAAEKIKIDDIKQLNEKIVYGNKRFSLELKNGKRRSLAYLKDQNEIAKIRVFLTKFGVLN